jgi:hypothetical protein
LLLFIPYLALFQDFLLLICTYKHVTG